MTESNYSINVEHLEDQGDLHLDVHMFFKKMQE